MTIFLGTRPGLVHHHCRYPAPPPHRIIAAAILPRQQRLQQCSYWWFILQRCGITTAAVIIGRRRRRRPPRPACLPLLLEVAREPKPGRSWCQPERHAAPVTHDDHPPPSRRSPAAATPGPDAPRMDNERRRRSLPPLTATRGARARPSSGPMLLPPLCSRIASTGCTRALFQRLLPPSVVWS